MYQTLRRARRGSRKGLRITDVAMFDVQKHGARPKDAVAVRMVLDPEGPYAEVGWAQGVRSKIT